MFRIRALVACSIPFFVLAACSSKSSTSTPNEPALAPFSATLACPAPNGLPFRTDSYAFVSASSDSIESTDPLVKFEPLDVIGLPTATQEVRGRFGRSAQYIAGTVPYAGEWVSLWSSASGSWQKLARVQTDQDGYYDVTLTGADAQKLGTSQIQAILEGDSQCATHGSFLWPAGTKVVVTDIDGTLTASEDEETNQLADPTYVPKENTAANLAMAEWHKKGYQVIFLTARAHWLRMPTHAWLAGLNMDFGPLVTSDSPVSASAAQAYKYGFLQKIVSYGWQIVAAYGNQESDIGAYTQAGVPKSAIFTLVPSAGLDGTQAIPNNDYTSHITNYIDKQPDVSPGF